MQEVTIAVEGMMCEMCEMHVAEAAKGIKGVKSVVADREKKTAVVTAKDTVDVEAIKTAIVDAGYQVGETSVRLLEKKGFFSKFKK